ncbi:MAG: hypothetical protein H7Y06_10385 [Opitutaceae bacterium]|nr:hypothetical protein [Opitutaceae bacterium]
MKNISPYLFKDTGFKKWRPHGLDSLGRCFVEHCEMFEHHFMVSGKDVGAHARSYLSGLMGTQGRKNIERIKADVAESNYQDAAVFE